MPTIQTITNASGTFPYVPNTRTLTINGVSYDLTADRSWTISTSGTGTVTSVGLSATMPTGLVATISGSPVTSNGTLGLTVTMQSGYAIPTTAKQTQWDSAYTFTSTFPSGSANQLLRINSAGTALEFFTASYLSSTGTTNYIPKFTSSTNIGNSIMTESSGIVTTYGANQIYVEQPGAGTSYLYVTNRDTSAAQTNNTILATQNLGSGQARTIINAASYTAGNKNRGELSILTENGSNFIANFGTQVSTGDNAFSLYSTSYVENIRLNTGGNSFLNGGNVGIGINSPTQKLHVYNIAPIILVESSTNTGGQFRAKNTVGEYVKGIEGSTAGGWMDYDVTNSAYITLYRPTSSGFYSIYTNANERLTINGIGNVGINQLNPTEKLDVVGNIKLSGNVLGGTWQGNTITPAYGGTGATTLTGVVIGNGTSTMTAVSGTAGQLLRRNAGNSAYEFFTASFIDTSRTITINGVTQDLSANRTYNVGTVTSVGITMPTGFSVASSPITTSGTIGITFASGYSLPTTAKQTEWDAAYNDKINSASVTGTTTKTLTLNQQDGGTITASWTDINTDAVTSVFGRTGAVIAANGDYTTAQVTESGNLYYTDARARAAISLTTTGSSGAATYTSGVLNIPNYTLSGLGGVSGSGTTNYIAKFTGSSILGDSQIIDNGTNVGIGITPTFKLHVNGTLGVVNDATFSASVTGANFNPTGSTVPTNGMYLSTTNTLNFATNSANRLSISPTGLVIFTDNARFVNQKGCVFGQTGGTLVGSISMDTSNVLLIDNNTFIGLSIGSNYTMTASNFGIGTNQFGTSGTRVISVSNGTAPSSSPLDSFQMYSADVTAGNAAPHFRTENGAVIKIYQETTSVGNSIFAQGGGNSVLDDSTFDGYTLRQIVKALRNQGILQ